MRLSKKKFEELPEHTKTVLEDVVEGNAALEFMKNHPEFVPSEENQGTMWTFLDERDWPITAKNLELAYRLLRSVNALTIKETL